MVLLWGDGTEPAGDRAAPKYGILVVLVYEESYTP